VTTVETNFHRPEDNHIIADVQRTERSAKCALVFKVLNSI
jgi:hypothetical protein